MVPPVEPRRRRAGEDDAAIQRAVDVTRRYASVRAAASVAPPGETIADDYDTVAAALATVVIGEFCDWIVVDVLRPRHRRLLALDGPARSGDAAAAAIVDRVPDLEAALERAAAEGRQQRLPADVTTGLARCLVMPLAVHDETEAVIALGRDEPHPGFGPMESTAADEMAWGAATTIERLDLRRRANAATAAAYRVAERLRDLLAASLSLQSTRDDHLARETVERARQLFNADTAVLVEDGPPRRVTRADEDPEHPRDVSLPPGGDRNGTWIGSEWLVCAVRDASGARRGRLGIHRTGPVADEDVEVMTLLTQTAATTMTTAELNATIRASEARWRVLVDSAPVGILEVDLEERVRWWNRAAASIFNWPGSPATVAPTLPADVLAPLRDLWGEVAAGELPSALEIRGVDIGGRARDLTVAARRLAASDVTQSTWLTLIDDITDRRQMREELRHAHTMEIRGLVAGTAIHDFNNLLTIISGYAELLVGELDEGPTREAATAIVATTSRAAALAGQLQTIGRTQRPDPSVLDPASVVESNAAVIERILGGAIAFSWSGPERGVWVRIDADRFEQMLLNLVINARDAMERGGEVRVEIERLAGRDLDAKHQVDRSSAYAVLRVIDTGTGMDEQTLAHCFDPMFTTKGPFAGTGLGLAAARRLMEESGGSIVARSVLGQGTTFETALPLVGAPAPSATPAEPPAEPPVATGGAMILVVENDDGLRHLVAHVLRRNGYAVLEAASGEAALESLDASLDLVVSDVVMGEVSGVDLAERIPVEPGTPAILLISGTADPSVLDGLAPRVCDFLAKPFRPSQLLDRVVELLARRGATR